MKIVFMHLHLKPGGVTTVISQQLSAVEDDCEVMVITGDTPPPDFTAFHVCVEGLGYDNPDFQKTTPDPHETAEAISSAIYRRWPDGCDIIHVHNPLLAKNIHLLFILELLKAKGFAFFLQVHDFAEDGRPWSYYENDEYPSDCHYGTINSRDCRILEKSGLKPDGVHELFNMVDPIAADSLTSDTPCCVLYPVRGIRRKNIGEALLLSLYFPPGTPLAVTLPPNSPMDWAVYDQWKSYTGNNNLNVIFEASSHYEFSALAANARFFISTSITEGFGFAFLEPWTAKKPLMGRRLPDISSDFAAQGIQLEHLYEKLFVPTTWIDYQYFEKQWKQCIQKTFARYGAQIDKSDASKGFERLTQNNMIDFCILSEPFQREIIDRILKDNTAYQYLEQINPVLTEIRLVPDLKHIIESNMNIVSKRYNRQAYKKRLLEVYENVLTVTVNHSIDKKMLLRQFLRPENFSLLKWCENDL